MSRAHDAFLQAVNNVPGVSATYLINNRGEVLMSLGQQRPADATAQLSVKLVQMVAAVEIVEGACEEMAAQFESGIVTLYTKLGILLETKYGVEEVLPAIVTSSKVNQSMLRMTVKVAATKLKGEPTVRGLAVSAQVDRRNLLQKNYLDDAGLEMVKALVRT